MVAKSNGVKAKKHLGQHFLEDPSVAERIATAIRTDDPQACILEIGPGTGALTRPLVQRFGAQVLALDVDDESVQFLQQQDWLPEGSVQHGDFLRMPLSDLETPGPLVVAGNFPYNISSQILFRVLDWRDRVPECVGMFQKEVAERVAEGPGSKTYGILSVLLQAYYDIDYLFTVHEHAFDPPPKVKSGVIRLVRNDVSTLPHGVSHAHFVRVVKAAFNQRRKTLRNSIKNGGFDATRIPMPFQGQRAEQLSVDEFQELAAALLD